jgi:hypothetical protein
MKFGRREAIAGGACCAAALLTSRSLRAQGGTDNPDVVTGPDPDEAELDLEPEEVSDYLCGTIDNTLVDELDITDFSADGEEPYEEFVARVKDELDITDFGTATAATRWKPSDGLTPDSGVVTLGCAFLSGTDRQQRTARYCAEKWMANGLEDRIRFEFGVPLDRAQVRIAIGRFGYLAQVGNNAKGIAPGQPTVQLYQGLERKKVMHEFGHVLGLRHEHQHPSRRQALKEQAVIDYFHQHEGWTPAVTYDAILKTWGEDHRCIGHPDFTYDSIMSYDIPGRLTVDGRPVKMARRISPNDFKCLIGLYSRPA